MEKNKNSLLHTKRCKITQAARAFFAVLNAYRIENLRSVNRHDHHRTESTASRRHRHRRKVYKDYLSFFSPHYVMSSVFSFNSFTRTACISLYPGPFFLTFFNVFPHFNGLLLLTGLFARECT